MKKLLKMPNGLLHPLLYPGPKLHEKNMGEKSYKWQILIKDLWPFQQWSNMKIIPLMTIANISENSKEFLTSLVNSLKIKFLHPIKRPMRMLSFKMRNFSNHEDFSSRQHSEATARRSFIKKLAIKIRKIHRKTRVSESYFNRVASLTLIKMDTVNIWQHFEENLFCKTHTRGCFWAFLKPQNKWYNDPKIGISVVNLHLLWRKLREKELDFHLIGIHYDHLK